MNIFRKGSLHAFFSDNVSDMAGDEQENGHSPSWNSESDGKEDKILKQLRRAHSFHVQSLPKL